MGGTALDCVSLNLKSKNTTCVFVELGCDLLPRPAGDPEGDLLSFAEELMGLGAIDDLRDDTKGTHKLFNFAAISLAVLLLRERSAEVDAVYPFVAKVFVLISHDETLRQRGVCDA